MWKRGEVVPHNKPDDDKVVDHENSKREEKDKEEKGEMVKFVDTFWFKAKEKKLCLSIHHNHIRYTLNSHAGCTLVKFYIWMLQLAEHESLW